MVSLNCWVWSGVVLGCGVATFAQEGALVSNGGFEAGLQGWDFRPGDASQASLVKTGGQRGTVLHLHPDGKRLGVETERLRIGTALRADRAYRVRAWLKSDGLDQGTFAFSMYCFDARGTSLEQIAFYRLTRKSRRHGWREVIGTFGPGTRNPLPEATQSVCIRFSFYDRSKSCEGGVFVDDVALAAYEPAAHERWPAEIVATVGDLGIRFESRSFWTLYRIDYKGTRLCLDRWGSHYGSVASFPGVGFIGTGHTENDCERLLDVRLFVDGEQVDRPKPRLRCREIRLVKTSRIRSLALKTAIQVADHRIVEHVRLKADRPTPVTRIYHFMHPWTPTATDYAAELLDGTRVRGVFDGDRGMKIDRPTRWSAIYDGPTGKGAVTAVLDAPPGDAWRTRYWDVPERYRKHYFTTFLNATVPADKELHYRVVTVPFEAGRDGWQFQAERLARSCGPYTESESR